MQEPKIKPWLVCLCLPGEDASVPVAEQNHMKDAKEKEAKHGKEGKHKVNKKKDKKEKKEKKEKEKKEMRSPSAGLKKARKEKQLPLKKNISGEMGLDLCLSHKRW